jgi:O-antigen/teichoic acid export membrane protein
LQKLLKNSFVLSVSEMLLKLAKFIVFVVIANVYSVEYLGLFNYIVSFLLIFSIIGELGINAYITTEQSKLKAFPDAGILSVGIFKIVTVLVMFCFAFIIYTIMDSGNKLLLTLVAILIFSDAILTLVYSFYRAVNRFKYEFYFKTMQAFIYGFTSFWMYYHSELGFIYFIAFIAVLNILLALFSLYKLTNFQLYVKDSFFYIQKNFMGHFKYILPIFLATVFTTLYFRIDIIMLESMVGIESVGYYSVAYKLIEGAMVLPLMLGVVLLPKLSNNRKNVKQDISVHFMLGLVIFVLFYFSVAYVIDFFLTNNYILSVDTAKILSYSIVIMSINTYMFTYFVAKKKSYINVKVTFVMLILNLILNYIYIPVYGMKAAAITTVATELIGMFALIYYMKKYYAHS